MINIKELRRLAQAVSGWGNCNQTWLDQSEDVPAVVVGHIGEDGETYPVVTIDCDQYYAADQSLPLGKFYAAANPAVINELLDRLEAAESDALEQARLNGMGASREAALMAKLEAAEKEVAHIKEVEFPRKVRAVAVEWETKCARLEQERDTLRARIEAMEQQEPVAQVGVHKTGGNAGIAWSARPLNEFDSLPLLREGTKLYAQPGAQPAPSVPDEFARDAKRYRYLRGRDDSTAGVGCWLEADGKACARGWLNGDQLDRAIDCAIEALSAAPEAKP